MKIKFLDLNLQTKNLNRTIINSLKYNIKNSLFINGPANKKFERNFSKYLSIKYCLGVANGTDALEIAIKCLNLGNNAEIIVPANTWISTAEAVLNTGNKVKFVDCDDTHNICIKDLKNKINKNTRAIMAVHLYGNPSNILEIKKICQKQSIKLIEDCAQSHGASINGKKTSSFGDISTFSFFPSKNLGCYGDGGAIVTNNKKYYLNAKKIANHGGLKKNSHTILGRNSRLDNLQADILSIKLSKLDKWIRYRQKLVGCYKTNLNHIKNINFIEQNKNVIHSNHLFVIRAAKRNQLKKFLEKNGIETAINYPKTLPETKLFKNKTIYYCKKMKIIKQNKKILSLPMGEHLKIKDIEYVSKIIKKFYAC